MGGAFEITETSEMCLADGFKKKNNRQRKEKLLFFIFTIKTCRKRFIGKMNAS